MSCFNGELLNTHNMKIAFIGGRDIHKLGGIEAYMYNLCTELVKMGHEPLVYCESDRNEVEQLNGFTVIHLKSFKSKYWVKPVLGWRAVKRTLKEHPEIEFYHFNHGGPSYFGGPLARIRGKITLMQLHGIESRRTKWSKFERFIMRATGPYVDRCTKYFSSVSWEQKELTEKRTHRRCWYIPTAVNLPTEIKDESALERFDLTHEGYYLYLGRLVQDKNPDYLIKAFIASGIKDKKLVIAGSNDTMPEYVSYLNSLAEGHDNIILTGAVYGDDKETLMKHCACFCIPSTIEGLAITLLEAMSYGRICIASDIPANIEGLGDNAIWVKAEDVDTLKNALLKVNEDFDNLKDAGQQNYERVRDGFTWPKVAKQYMDMVDEIMSEEKK